MSEGAPSWVWPALFLLGAYHGINPGMGWLFAVALGMQEQSGRAVRRALLPLGLGHALAIGIMVGLAVTGLAVFPPHILKTAVALILLAFGFYYLLRKPHLRWAGMMVGFGDLTLWSFLMASAHGAGLMVLPILFGAMSHDAATAVGIAHHPPPTGGLDGPWTPVWVVLVHLAGYLTVTGLVAWVVYEKLGLALLRKAWINFDLVWSLALIASSAFVLLV